ncbi:MAG: response regulator [Patescibacteria group bacterium]
MNKADVKVLLVEDDSFLSKMYQTKLAIENFTVIVAGDGQEGLSQALLAMPDIILLDIILPTMSGWDVLEKLKSQVETKDIPVILLTNLGQKEDIDRGLKLGANDYLIKAHFTPAEVVKKIHDVINKK